jgi:NADH-quinone oxidoreductase subunit G
VLRVLGNLLDAPGFDYDSAEAVLSELQALADQAADYRVTSLGDQTSAGIKVADLDVPIYSVDPLVRRAASLQQTVDAVAEWRKTG